MIRTLSLLAAAALAAAAGGAQSAPAKPMRVMSINLCGDQLAMMLLPPERLGSVTYLARRASATPALEARARRTRINHGLAEEVLAEKPDLIVGSPYTSPATRRVAGMLHIPIVELEPAEGFADVRAQMRRLGRAFGESARAEAWIAHMDARLAELARTAPARPIAAVGWDSAGRVPGERSMFNDMLRAAGARNLAAGPGRAERTLDLEQLLRLEPKPDVLLYGASLNVRAGERVNLQQHPALARAYAARRLAYPQNATACGTPHAADAAAALRSGMLAALADHAGG
jgi:iron complex transport system substrate-binding protein